MSDQHHTRRYRVTPRAGGEPIASFDFAADAEIYLETLAERRDDDDQPIPMPDLTVVDAGPLEVEGGDRVDGSGQLAE